MILKKCICFLILISSLSFCYANDIEKSHLDSLNQVVHNMGCHNLDVSDSIITKILEVAIKNDYYEQAGYAYESSGRNLNCRGKYPEAIEQVRKSINFFRKSGNLLGESKVTFTMTTSFRRIHEIDSALKYADRIYDIALILNDKEIESKSYTDKGSSFIEGHQQDSALYYSLAALKIIESQGKKFYFESAVLLNIATAYNMNGEPEKAKNMFLRVEKLMEVTKNEKGLANSIYGSLGRNYIELEKYDSAIYALKKGLVIGKELKNNFMLAYLNRGLGNAYWLNNEQKKAIEHMERSLQINEISSLNGNQAVVYASLVKFYTGTRDFKKAIEVGERGIKLTENKNQALEKDIHGNLAHAYEKSGNLAMSLSHLKSKIELEKKLQEETKSREFAKLQTQYETEKKDQKIELLSQQASIQTLEIQRKNQGIIIGVVSLLFLASIAYFIYKQRLSKSQKTQVEIEQRFLRSQLNPHFISNALVAVQNYLLKNKPEIAAIYLGKFSKLMREILENSRKEFIPVEDEVEMLTNYLEIHKLRLNSSFDFKITIDENIDREMETIPPMFVQPFVENAIEHGIINKNGEGLIEVHLIKENEYITIEIKDNGSGIIQNSQLNKDKSHNSLSSTIIQERIGLFNKSLKNKIKLVMDDIKIEGVTKGTKVALKVPYSYA